MPELDITIGGKVFQVACQEGEEHFLRSAAKMLDAEAQPLVAQLGRLPEARLLLMAGLMLADKTAALEDELRAVKARMDTTQAQKIEVPVVPAEVFETLSEIAARAEAMAAQIEERAAV
jgi:cell division protein ZapA